VITSRSPSLVYDRRRALLADAAPWWWGQRRGIGERTATLPSLARNSS
jgi:hypothetical protein